MRITRFGLTGIAFYLLMVGAFFATPYSNPFFLLLGFLTCVGLFAAFGALRNLRGVSAILPELDPVPSDTPSRVAARLESERSGRFQVGLQVELASGERIGGKLDLLDERADLGLDAPALPRGCYPVRRAWVESDHPLGIFRRRRPVDAPQDLVVYPSPEALLEDRSAAQALEDLLGTGDPGAGDLQPSSLRDHREGDGIRGIHWRASARRGRLVVQEWEGGSGQGLEVVLDRRCAPEDLESALQTVSAMLHLAKSGKETLRLHSQDHSATYGEGQSPWSEALRFLACAQALPTDGPAPPPVSPSVTRLPKATAHA